MRLIDADELKEIAHEMIQEDPDAFNGGYSYNAVTVDEIDEAPTIEATPVVHAEWIKSDLLFGADECTNCHASIYNTSGMNFCPNCGADMRKGGVE